jgi:uncharacterized protein YfiM (DUF2279 family)
MGYFLDSSSLIEKDFWISQEPADHFNNDWGLEQCGVEICEEHRWLQVIIWGINFPIMIDAGDVRHFIKFPVEHITIKILLLLC